MKGLAPPKDIFDNIFKGNNHERDAGIHNTHTTLYKMN